MKLLFIHHSCGGQLLCDRGPAVETSRCVYTSHPNGGGRRARLVAAGYDVHEASYGTPLGDATDLFDWVPKFRDHGDELAAYDVVMFKSCYPNNRFEADGAEPGKPAGPDLTLANARATLRALRPYLEARPATKFVYVTAPPNAPHENDDPGWKLLAKRALGRETGRQRLVRRAALARRFHDWAKSPDGWLAGYPHENVLVFDYFDVLTDHGASNLSRYASAGGRDSHPTAKGNARAAAALAALLGAR
jgi:hypothetical protein